MESQKKRCPFIGMSECGKDVCAVFNERYDCCSLQDSMGVVEDKLTDLESSIDGLDESLMIVIKMLTKDEM